ncbi:MAG: nucleotidyltransferase [Clostridiales bacterium]|nr:nucleotidyltransferase [Clostridiales bacterium]
MTLVIMAAGMGSRYGGLKQIDPITEHGEFIVDFSIYDAVQAGFDKVVFIIKEENYDVFRETVGKRVEKAVEVKYAFQKMDNIPDGFTLPEGREKPWGTGHAVLAAADVVNEPFAVINADDFYGRDAFVKLHKFLCEEKSDTARAHYAMAGYILENTITENGYVSRGICDVKNGFLQNVVERTKIQENDGVVQYCENDNWVDIDRKSVVSMNCWAFTPEIFSALHNGFVEFLTELPNTPNPLKAEFFLPFLVQHEIDCDTCDVRVLETSAKWYGVTYHEDKPRFVEFIKNETAAGVYPDGLWK